METKSCSVVFEGKIVTGRTIEEVKKNLALLFKSNAGQIDLLFSRPATSLKKDLSRATALKYQRAFEKMGAICRIQADEAPESPAVKMGLGGSKTSAGFKENHMTCPMCNYAQARAEECVRCGTVIRKYMEKISRATAISATTSSATLGRQSSASPFRARWLFPVPVILLLLIALFGWRENSTIPQEPQEPAVIVPAAPVQSRISNPQKFSYKGYQITPLAAFEIEARVLSTKRYYSGRQADLSPIDLALGWGPMSDESILKDIDVRQSNRFYFWKVKQFPIPRREIQNNSANMHIIPADKHVKERLKEIRKGHLVRFIGFLVRVDSQDNWHWKSSLTRKDTGNGACELIWVEELEFI